MKKSRYYTYDLPFVLVIIKVNKKYIYIEGKMRNPFNEYLSKLEH